MDLKLVVSDQREVKIKAIEKILKDLNLTEAGMFIFKTNSLEN